MCVCGYGTKLTTRGDAKSRCVSARRSFTAHNSIAAVAVEVTRTLAWVGLPLDVAWGGPMNVTRSNLIKDSHALHCTISHLNAHYPISVRDTLYM